MLFTYDAVIKGATRNPTGSRGVTMRRRGGGGAALLLGLLAAGVGANAPAYKAKNALLKRRQKFYTDRYRNSKIECNVCFKCRSHILVRIIKF